MKSIIIYDFDGTLTPYSLPKFEILEKCGLQHGALNPNFLEMSKNKAQDEKVDLYTAIYRTYFEIIKNANLSLSDDNFCLGANTVIYNNGVVDFLNFLKDNGVSNYLLSSGIKVYLEKTNIAHFFEKIYGTTFIYNSNGEAIGIDYLMSDKNKVDAIKDIVKMTGNNENDCQNIIYIGDGFTDYYAMEYELTYSDNTSIPDLKLLKVVSKLSQDWFGENINDIGEKDRIRLIGVLKRKYKATPGQIARVLSLDREMVFKIVMGH